MSDPTQTDEGAGVTTPPADAGKPASRWEDFIDIFYTPSSVFARRATSGFAVPMIVVTVLLGAIYLANMGVMQPIMDSEFARGTAAAMKKNPQITAEQMQQFRGMSEKFGILFVLIGLPVGMFLTGLFLWIIGKFVDAKQTLTAAIMVASYAFIPKVVEAVVNGVQGLLMDPASMTGRLKLSLGVGRFFDPDTTSPVLLAAVARIDVFTIWETVLLAIGLSVTGKIGRQKAAIAAVLLWIVGMIPSLLSAARQ